jgi:hypothetical protein
MMHMHGWHSLATNREILPIAWRLTCSILTATDTVAAALEFCARLAIRCAPRVIRLISERRVAINHWLSILAHVARNGAVHPVRVRESRASLGFCQRSMSHALPDEFAFNPGRAPERGERMAYRPWTAFFA